MSCCRCRRRRRRVVVGLGTLQCSAATKKRRARTKATDRRTPRRAVASVEQKKIVWAVSERERQTSALLSTDVVKGCDVSAKVFVPPQNKSVGVCRLGSTLQGTQIHNFQNGRSSSHPYRFVLPRNKNLSLLRYTGLWLWGHVGKCCFGLTPRERRSQDV